MLRVELKANSKPTDEQIKKFKKDNPNTKIRFQKDGRIFVHIDERACSSGAEHCVDIAKVEGAKPSTPTNE